MQIHVQLLWMVMMLGLLPQQASKPDFYIESWKKGDRQIQEGKVLIELNKDKPKHEVVIKDSTGWDRFNLSFFPGRAPSPSTDITQWGIELVNLYEEKDINLLKPTNDPEQDYFAAEDYVWVLYPTENPPDTYVPLSMKRVVKIEEFYCLISVESYRLNPQKKKVFDFIKVCIEFKNQYKGD